MKADFDKGRIYKKAELKKTKFVHVSVEKVLNSVYELSYRACKVPSRAFPYTVIGYCLMFIVAMVNPY